MACIHQGTCFPDIEFTPFIYQPRRQVHSLAPQSSGYYAKTDTQWGGIQRWLRALQMCQRYIVCRSSINVYIFRSWMNWRRRGGKSWAKRKLRNDTIELVEAWWWWCVEIGLSWLAFETMPRRTSVWRGGYVAWIWENNQNRSLRMRIRPRFSRRVYARS